MVEAIPVAISFFFLFMAVGAIAATAGLSGIEAILMTVVIFAAPLQLVIADMVAQQSWAMAILTTAIVNARFSVMSAALIPYFQGKRPKHLLGGLSLISVSTFGVSFMRFAREKPAHPFEYYLGVCLMGFGTAIPSTAIGFAAAAHLGGVASDVMRMILPVYFTTMLAKEWGRAKPLAAAAIGFAGAPILNQLVPNFGMILAAGLAGAVLTLWERAQSRLGRGDRP